MIACPKHKRYKVKRRPLGLCEACWAMWLTSGKASITLKPKLKKVVEGLLELEAAEKRCPTNLFVQDVRRFYTERGFLTPKQIAALKKAEPNYRSVSPFYDDFDVPCDVDLF